MNRPAWVLSESEFWERHRQVVREELTELMAPASSALLTIAEAAELCRCSTRHIRRLRADGLPVVYVGDAPRFDRDAVLTWLRERSANRDPARLPPTSKEPGDEP